MKDAKIINHCLLCDGKTKNILSLNSSPLANEFVSDPTIVQDLFPLNIIQCTNCNHVQLDCVVDRERLFRNYYYVAGTSTQNIKHFQDYANTLIDKFSLSKNSTIVEIASNDGTLLRNFINKGINVIGIDPARNIAAQANKDGIFTIAEFFGPELAEDILADHGKADVVVCNNMLAHNENITDIIIGVKTILKDTGTFVFENSYLLDICDKTLIDLFYHEHLHHFHIKPLIQFFSKLGMDVYDVERLPNHGGSIRVYTCFKDTKEIDKSVGALVELETNINYKLEELNGKVEKLGKQLRDKLNEIKEEGKTVGIFGQPAKAATLLYTFNIDENIIEASYDNAKEKINLFSPGKHIKILHPNEIYNRKPDYLLILAWNFSENIILNHKRYLDNGGKFIVPLPEMKIITKE
jgi:SAM-dependent methyltransferase